VTSPIAGSQTADSPPNPFAHNMVHFVRYLRARGIDTVPGTGAELADAVGAVGLDNRNDAFFALRAMTVTRREDLAVFEDAFDVFFGHGWRQPRPQVITPPERVAVQIPTLAGRDLDLPDDEIEEATEQLGASFSERLAKRDFSELTPDEIAEVRRMIARMVWHPAEALSRRWIPNRKGRRPDMRRTLRNVVGPESDLLPMEFSSRKHRRRPLVLIADVSGSMEKYVEMVLYFAHAAPARMGRVETFVFSTRLTRVTHELRRRDPAAALRLVSDSVHDWSGGTRIGDTLQTFNRVWSRRVCRGGPIGVIISDGWDRGDPGLLAEEMARFHRTMHRVVWLNPLAGREGYAPETRGMRTALPYIDDFLPAASLSDLSEVVRLLESIPARR
jgi:uncharacterized protein with von Willebrand factor type A (vWA) domain